MKEENYLLKDFINERTVNVEKEFENDIVFAKFINYMKVALLHKKLNFLKHQKYLYLRFTHRTKHPFCVLYAERFCLAIAKRCIIRGNRI